MGRQSNCIKFGLDSGRIVNVDLLILESEYKEIHSDSLNEAGLPLLIKRRNLDRDEPQWFDSSEVLYIFPDQFPSEGTNDGYVLITVLLWSDPVSEDFGFSELMVVFFSQYQKNSSIEQMLYSNLHDLDWDRLAIDRKGTLHWLTSGEIMGFVEDARNKISITLQKFEDLHGLSGQLAVSKPYDLMLGKNTAKYPNSDLPGVYIFASEAGVLNVGKSRNQIGAQLQRDVKSWLERDYFSQGKRVVLFTINTGVSHSDSIEEFPLLLERFLKEELAPIEP